jgi:hypothetical protein
MITDSVISMNVVRGCDNLPAGCERPLRALGVPGAWKKGCRDADAAACAISRERKSAVAKKVI